jgi:alcohol dehydrogenase, propanol-preferring
MKAMVLEKLCSLDSIAAPLVLSHIRLPAPGNSELLIKVSACGVCHTELDEIEGRTPPPVLPVVPGHQIVGRVEAPGNNAKRFKTGDRVGIAWIHSACGKCEYCNTGAENLCPDFAATGRDVNGGYAEYTVVPERFAFSIPDIFSDSEAAPLLCAGAVGYRSLALTQMKDGDTLGLAGFGASGHLVFKIVRHLYPKSRIFIFSRTEGERKFSMELGAHWAGDFDDTPPGKLNCAIDTTPVWKPVVDVLRHLAPGGRLVINAIRKEDKDRDQLLRLDYSRDLWMEKEIKSVANVTRADVENFLGIAAEIPLKPEIEEYRLEDANIALMEIKKRKIRGAKVLKIG